MGLGPITTDKAARCQGRTSTAWMTQSMVSGLEPGPGLGTSMADNIAAW